MMLHARRVILVGPDTLNVVAFSPAQEWRKTSEEMATRLRGRAARHSYALVMEPHVLDEELERWPDVFRCPACNALKACSVYENQCERIADAMSLLSAVQNSDGRWAWLGPEQVIELARVAEDPEEDARMRRIIGIQSASGGGLRDSLVGMFRDEFETAKGYAHAARNRLKKKVSATAGAAAGRAVDDIVDNVVDIGTAAFRQKFRSAASGTIHQEPDEVEQAQRTLGVKPGATDREIDAAWKEMAQKFHPDRNPGDEAWASGMMGRINAARAILKKHNAP